jgi:hypothetical protein
MPVLMLPILKTLGSGIAKAVILPAHAAETRGGGHQMFLCAVDVHPKRNFEQPWSSPGSQVYKKYRVYRKAL